MLEVDFENLRVYFQPQKCRGSRFCKLLYFFSNLEAYVKYTFNIDIFIFKLGSLLEVEFLSACFSLLI